MIEPSEQAALDGLPIHGRCGSPLDHTRENSLVRVVLKKQTVRGSFGINNEVAGSVQHERFLADCFDCLDGTNPVRIEEGSGIALDARANLTFDAFGLLLSDHRDEFNLVPEHVDVFRADVLQHRPPPSCTHDSGFAVDPVDKEALEAVARQVTDGLLGIFATKDEKPKIRVGETIRDHSLNAQILRMHRTDYRKALRLPGR